MTAHYTIELDALKRLENKIGKETGWVDNSFSLYLKVFYDGSTVITLEVPEDCNRDDVPDVIKYLLSKFQMDYRSAFYEVV